MPMIILKIDITAYTGNRWGSLMNQFYSKRDAPDPNIMQINDHFANMRRML